MQKLVLSALTRGERVEWYRNGETSVISREIPQFRLWQFRYSDDSPAEDRNAAVALIPQKARDNVLRVSQMTSRKVEVLYTEEMGMNAA